MHCLHYVFYFIHLVPLNTIDLPVNLTVNETSDASFYCEFEGTDIDNITWISPDNTVIMNNESNINIQEGGLFPFNKSSSLSLMNVSRQQNEGWYTCRCFAGEDYQEASAYLSIQGTCLCH